MKYKVLALKEMDPLGHKILEQIGAEFLTAPETASEEEILDLIAKNQVDAIYSRTDKVDRAMMDASPRLKVVAKQGVRLDVFEQEPLPLSSELFTMENVVLTPPHTAASTNQSVRNCTYLACQGMVDALLGHQRISNQANRF